MRVYEPKNVLITGGAGFIGSNFIHYLLKTAPHVHVINLDLLTYAGNLENLKNLPDPQRHLLVQGDIGDKKLLQSLFIEHRIDTVIHFAAESHVDRSIHEPEVFVKTNVLGTFYLLETALNYWEKEFNLNPLHCHFHHISTDEVFGSLSETDLAFTESTPYAPNSPYSATKAGADHLVRAYHHTFKLPTTISNCSNNYGPRQDQEKLIPKMIARCLTGEDISLYGRGENVRDWLYVDDHSLAIDRIIRNGAVGAHYNIGGHCQKTNIDVVNTVCAVFDTMKPRETPYADLIRYVTDRPGHDFRYAVDTKKLANELNWSPSITFETGLRETIRWYLNFFETL